MRRKAKHIKLLVLDCDGVLTQGHFYYGHPDEVKDFNTKDGLGIAMFQQYGYSIAIITGKKSEALEKRCQDLGIKLLFQGVKNKLKVLNDIRIELSLDWENIAYIGDDLNDFQCLSKAKFSACPADANQFLFSKVDYVCDKTGGKGCVREVIDYILKSKKELKDAQNSFIKSLSNSLS